MKEEKGLRLSVSTKRRRNMNIKKFRERNLLSKTDLAKKLNVSITAVSKWESGHPISPKMLRIFKYVFGMNTEQFDNFLREE